MVTKQIWRVEDVIAKLREEQGERSLRDYASNTLGIDPAYLSRVFSGIQEPGPKILSRLGIEKQRNSTYKSKRWR